MLEQAVSVPLREHLQEARRMVDQGQAKRGIELAEATQKQAEHAADAHSVALAQLYQGLHWRILSDYPHAIVCTQQAIAGLAGCHDVNGQIEGLCNLAYVYCDLGNYEKALDYLTEADDIADNADAASRAKLLYHFGLTYLRLRNYQQARSFYERALILGREHDDQDAIAQALTGLGILDMGSNPEVGAVTDENRPRFQRAVARLELALTHAQRAGNQVLYLRILGNIGVGYIAMNDTERALRYFQQQLDGLRAIQQRQAVSVCLSNIGEVYRHLGRHQDSVTYLQQALLVANEIGTKRWAALAHQELSKTFEAMGDSLRAFSHYKLYHSLEQEIFNDQAKRKANTLALRLELERGQKDMESQRSHSANLERANRELTEHTEVLAREAREDGLTGLLNRRYLDIELRSRFEHAKREGRKLSLAIIDIDHFKFVNDQFSHLVGDAVVRTVASLLRKHARASDLVGRYGGDEFIIAFPDQSLPLALRTCERLRNEVLHYPWSDLAPRLAVTLTIGVTDEVNVADCQQALTLADNALYQAKALGRNRVQAYFAPAPHAQS